jgi:predicted  nucleic acid-binding Zn-ribbon protein
MAKLVRSLIEGGKVIDAATKIEPLKSEIAKIEAKIEGLEKDKETAYKRWRRIEPDIDSAKAQLHTAREFRKSSTIENPTFRTQLDDWIDALTKLIKENDEPKQFNKAIEDLKDKRATLRRELDRLRDVVKG